MSIFDEREKAAERRFEHERELAFKTHARRNKRLGLWAAARIGLSGDRAERYALDLVAAEMGAHGDAAVIERICADFIANGVSASADDVRSHLALFAKEARNEFMRGETKAGAKAKAGIRRIP
jgi:hypothetical protein